MIKTKIVTRIYKNHICVLHLQFVSKILGAVHIFTIYFIAPVSIYAPFFPSLFSDISYRRH